MKKNLVGIFTRSRLGRFFRKYGGKISAILDVVSIGVSLLTKPIHGVVDSVLLGVEAFRKIKTGSKLGGLLSAAKKGLKIDKLFSKIKNNRYLKGILNNKNLKVVGKSVYKFVVLSKTMVF